jgi:hypothetical protein
VKAFRYDINVCECTEGPHVIADRYDDGEWVRASDAEAEIKALEAERDKWRERAKKLGKRANHEIGCVYIYTKGASKCTCGLDELEKEISE